jgi:hypothetical protein
VERASRKLARQTFYGMSRWQGKLERKQRFLARVVDIGAELFAMSACCVRARMLRQATSAGNGDPEFTGAAYELADAFCRQARERINELFRGLWHNTDELDGRLARRVLAGRYEWVEEGVLDASIAGPWIADAAPGPSLEENVHRPFPSLG